MTSKVKGTEGIEFPDSTVQGSAAVVNGPAFSANNSSTTAAGGSTVQVVFDTENFDTGNAFDGTKFTPLVAGYYQVNARTSTGADAVVGSIQCTLRKNGSIYTSAINTNVAGFPAYAQVSEVVYMNGTTDYLDVQARNSANANIGPCTFSAALVRKA